ncbi:TRAP transporter small permease [Salipiger marinus]|jgi:TRAP-type C4-dicarboxylate transport system permease small subunit|uniref:TRAP transporter small permease protein n=1 Tax=Salipiger marinus TaxID=555512 RepID=A0A1G8M1N8_9RHOB|nr:MULTISPECIES: TRAP transporter small permease [Salipiger]HBM58910.1 TRAP transporter small permease [Citreicella sp.]MCD1619025.1 TRAP transporter small permease [Salipiger manganoxidans]MEB3420212.1 TRAP transporter small permease [Salipiger manganoxidans]SDI61869.1 TRAP-type C4-dicarboxylate transport system, small permease component [Salipiger marinus]HBT00932.1 TRAP transporter small permease [Citreicella sp.]|tara:strand:- start:2314 stop:2838 length:525 start_codon:yes stop_codon:yes gene_type:complete
MTLLRAIEAHFERAILAIILFALVAILAAQVVFRYLVGSPLVWSEELARYLLVWCTFIGVSLAVREGRNISVDLLPVMCGARWLRAFAVLALVGSAVFFALMVWYSVPLTQRIAKIGQASPGLGLQMWLVYAAVPVGLGMAFLRALQALWLMSRGAPVPGTTPGAPATVIQEDV